MNISIAHCVGCGRILTQYDDPYEIPFTTCPRCKFTYCEECFKLFKYGVCQNCTTKEEIESSTW